VTAASQRLPNLVIARTLSEYARLMVLLARRESKGWVAVRKARSASHTASL
jgi:hypothetical protein